MKYLPIGFCFILALIACQQSQSTATTAIQPSVQVDTALYENISCIAITQNKGFAEGVTPGIIIQQKGKALSFIKRVLVSMNLMQANDFVDIDVYPDSSFYQIDYSPFTKDSLSHTQSRHLFFFPKTKKLFYFSYGDTLTTSEVLYDTLKFKY